MFPLLSCFFPFGFCVFARDRRAATRHSAPVVRSRPLASMTRVRRGVRAAAKTSWRRVTTGSNHISAFGVWRDRSRRAMTRINRTGETRWHRLPAAGGFADRSVIG